MKKLKTYKTLVVDGESLLKTGFFGRKDLQNEGYGIGAIFHFILTIRNFVKEYNYSKVVVMWDHPNSGWFRIQYYPFYKWNRKERKLSEFDEYSLAYQRVRIKQYLEELFIRQLCAEDCEADDLIYYYVKNSKDENKTVYTADHDMLQLLSKDTDVYLTNKRDFINRENFYTHFGYHYKNALLVKILEGDASDNIAGIKNLAQKTILKKFPELKDKKKDIDFIKNKCSDLIKESKKDNVAKNILDGNTKIGKMDNYFYIMDRLINLENEMITEDAKRKVLELINLPLDASERSEETAMRMWHEDEIINLLPSSENGFYEFFKPFLKIKNKELQKLKKDTNGRKKGQPEL